MTEPHSSSIATLPGFLTWEAGNDLIRTACETYIAFAYRRLREWSRSADAGVFEAVVRLPKSGQRRLLLAPRLHNLLYTRSEPSAEDVACLKQYIGLEQYLCDQNAQPPRAPWTALGDVYLPPGADAGAQPAGGWDAGRRYQAPVLRGIVLDAYSPPAVNRYPDYYGEVGQHTAEEMAVIERRLRESLEHIRSVSGTAGSAVGAAVQVISLIRVPAVTTGTHSFSNRSIIGLMGLINLHAGEWTTQRISNAIIHESVHSLIYKLQLNLANTLYTDEAAAERLTAVSPWSGRTLFLHSIVHACFVWFGLWSFWRLSPVDNAEVAGLREKARRGFLSGPLAERLGREAYDCIHPETRLAIEEMFERVTGSLD
jgi:hypothetical protein